MSYLSYDKNVGPFFKNNIKANSNTPIKLKSHTYICYYSKKELAYTLLVGIYAIFELFIKDFYNYFSRQ
jgi:hypothetical protein